MSGVSKVIFGGETVVDLTSDTVTPQTLASGITAHSANGEQIVGLLNVATVDSELSGTSENPIQNKVVKAAIDELSSEIADLNEVVIPDYWQTHLSNKIETIKALQDDGGKDCFSFIVIADSHYPSNLGKKSPLLAKHILNECDIKYVLHLGDTQTRGCHATKELLLTENDNITKMLKPIQEHLLRTQGNHEGNYGTLNGSSYVYRLTQEEMYNHIYRKVGKHNNCHFDSSGTGYWVDDSSAKVRYIILNCHNTKYETNEDGTQKHSAMRVFRFCQSQYDMVVNALNSIPDDDYVVVVGGHVALGTNGGFSAWGSDTESNADCTLMNNLLSAYKSKTSFSGVFVGTPDTSSGPTVNYTNLFDTSEDGYIYGSRFNASGNVQADTGAIITNYISVVPGDVIHVKGIESEKNGGARYCRICVYTDDGSKIVMQSTSNASYGTASYDDSVFTFMVPNPSGYTVDSIQIGGYITGTVDDVIVTKNENIEVSEVVESTHGYDHVEVDADFTNAKGQIVGFFGGHVHFDSNNVSNGINRITTRCDAKEENNSTLNEERVVGTITEQSFDVFTVNKKRNKIYATKIGAGSDREINY